ncbi:hypothetical protein AJ80_00346 [Polytolypa hystricis UAMH7299]|uniref:GED domain-containing protein n=1 Tax=Polytolypa hystricis (strain UAMH7299) TaxID=1447883 RepID=A0A2B7Z4C0_POLH7|nr:hypothetical protein AJ80_00346 [Polytolypa hystricis UAMH7299]
MAIDTNLDTSTLNGIWQSDQRTLLDEIDKLRLQGISEFVFLPQIVVCGDQSSGKSSVLEAISGVPFPRNDTLCTRFATEVILREAPVLGASVSIVPSQDASDSESEKLKAFKEALIGLDDLPGLIERTKDKMGISSTGNAFSKHILRVEISGPKKPKLTVVDLPGLIHSDSKQQSESDVELISNLVRSYMDNPRSIILAVVSAKNDFANQIILKRARVVDPKGLRTLGLITKPDTLPAGSDSEAEFLDLASNNNISFRLGWHIVKNRDYEQRHCSTEARDQFEADFFSKGAWKDLPRNMVGVGSLRDRLSRILLDQIKRYLPNLTEDIKSNIEESERKLAKLGDSRATLDEQRHFLLKLSQSFQGLCKAAVSGSYEDTFFGPPHLDNEYRKRLRAVVQNENISFEENMRKHGHHRIILADGVVNGTESGDQIIMSRRESINWVRNILVRSRGRELPGSFNPLLVGELFQDQSSPWESITRKHVETVWNDTKRFLESALATLADDETFQAVFTHFMDKRIHERHRKAIESLDRLLVDRRRHPITYNHYYTETLQNMKDARRSEQLTHMLKTHLVNRDYISDEEVPAIVKSLMFHKESNMDDFASSELLDSMRAYYKVTLKTFVDNVSIQVVEADLVGDIWTIFTPTDVGKLTPEDISRLAGESTESQALRQQLRRKLKTLRKGLEICQKYTVHYNPEHDADDVVEAENGKLDSAEEIPDEIPTAEGIPGSIFREGEVECDIPPPSPPPSPPPPPEPAHEDCWGSAIPSKSKNKKKQKYTMSRPISEL